MQITARQKLNSAYVLGNATIAALLGVVAGSTAVFFIALGLLSIASLYTGDIRPTGRKGK